MKLGVGLWAVSLVLLAFSCGRSESDDDTGSGGKGTGGASATGSGGKSAAGGAGPTGGDAPTSGRGGAAAGRGAPSATGGDANASSVGGAGGTLAQGGSDTAAAGAGASEPVAGQSGSGDMIGASGSGGGGSANGSLTMFVMFDRSWSMRECGDGNETLMTNNTLDCDTLSRWDLTSAALIQFFQDPAAAGLNVALRFFPHDEPAEGCDGYPASGSGFPPADGGTPPDASMPGLNCDIDACSQPLVPVGRLTADPAPTDAHETALVNAIQASTPPGPELPNPQPATPTFPALAGAENWAKAYRATHPDEPLAVVLVTDGEAQGCDQDLTHIANLASEAKQSAGVLTYAIGLSGSSEASLSQIAAAGGTERAFFVSDGSTAVQDLFGALSTIRAGAR
jgi:hypothetical protein